MKKLPTLCIICLMMLTTTVAAQDNKQGLDAAFAAIEPKVIEWRRDIHQHPELSNREVRTAKKVADHLRSFGFVRSGPASLTPGSWVP